jgi:hypothetical protein
MSIAQLLPSTHPYPEMVGTRNPSCLMVSRCTESCFHILLFMAIEMIVKVFREMNQNFAAEI